MRIVYTPRQVASPGLGVRSKPCVWPTRYGGDRLGMRRCAGAGTGADGRAAGGLDVRMPASPSPQKLLPPSSSVRAAAHPSRWFASALRFREGACGVRRRLCPGLHLSPHATKHAPVVSPITPRRTHQPCPASGRHVPYAHHTPTQALPDRCYRPNTAAGSNVPSMYNVPWYVEVTQLRVVFSLPALSLHLLPLSGYVSRRETSSLCSGHTRTGGSTRNPSRPLRSRPTSRKMTWS